MPVTLDCRTAAPVIGSTRHGCHRCRPISSLYQSPAKKPEAMQYQRGRSSICQVACRVQKSRTPCRIMERDVSCGATHRSPITVNCHANPNPNHGAGQLFPSRRCQCVQATKPLRAGTPGYWGRQHGATSDDRQGNERQQDGCRTSAELSRAEHRTCVQRSGRSVEDDV